MHHAMMRMLFLYLLAPPCSIAAAVEIDEPYVAEAVVTGTQEPERTRGMRLALSDVAIKLTGNTELEGSALLKPLLEDPHRFVATFDYEDRMKGIPVHDEQGTRERPHDLRVRFDPARLDAALDKLGLRRWSLDRPRLAVWLAIRTADDTSLLREKGPVGYGQRAVIQETSARRGIPVLLPPADLQLSWDPESLERGDWPASVFQAALPDADAHLVGTLAITQKGYWTIGWRLLWAGTVHEWRLQDVSFDTALKDGLQHAARLFSGN